MEEIVKYYDIPDECWHRIHFVRPRFKNNIENVLLYMASECCRIPTCTCEEFSQKYFEAIKMFPGNIGMAEKTLHNWRTEIPALFSFYTEDKKLNISKASRMASFLYERQDLTQFLRLFLFSFQFPGGHLKPQDLKAVIHLGIRFKPAKAIIQVLIAGEKILNGKGSMSISAEEATYCIFNDVRFTNGTKTPAEVARTILENRKSKLKYYNRKDHKIFTSRGIPRTKGDVTRYAGDILDYMEIANLLDKNHSYYSLKGNEMNSIMTFANDTSFFHKYDKFYNAPKISSSELSSIEPQWFEYVNDSMNPDLFKTDIRNILSEFIDSKQYTTLSSIDKRIKFVLGSEDKTIKDIGNLGEAIICGHEKMRLKINGYDDYIRLVQIVDSPVYHPGFDIDSFEADGTEHHRYIEVKTTISKQKINLFNFHMSTNEWSVAETIREHYCVYRLMLSEKDKTLYIIRNPVGLYKSDTIEARPRNGMEISFNSNNFKTEELLTWKE